MTMMIITMTMMMMAVTVMVMVIMVMVMVIMVMVMVIMVMVIMVVVIMVMVIMIMVVVIMVMIMVMVMVMVIMVMVIVVLMMIIDDEVVMVEQVDTMIIQAIGLLDDLDKELNTYAMRVREWYGWHFPEMTKIVSDNVVYAKSVKFMGTRENAKDKDFSAIITEEDVEALLKETAEISMGTEISEEDLANIACLCDQVISLSDYRAQLYDYLKSRMAAIAPNLTVLVGKHPPPPFQPPFPPAPLVQG